jgi:hypothetical protein
MTTTTQADSNTSKRTKEKEINSTFDKLIHDMTKSKFFNNIEFDDKLYELGRINDIEPIAFEHADKTRINRARTENLKTETVWVYKFNLNKNGYSMRNKRTKVNAICIQYVG